MTRVATRWRGCAVAVVAALCDCASGPTLHGGVYRDRERGFAIAAPPPDWQRIGVEDARLAFRGPNHESMALLTHCDAGDAAPAVLARRLRVGLGAHQLDEEHTTELAGRPAEVQWITVGESRVKAVTRVASPCVEDFVLVARDDFGAAERVFDAWWASFAPAREATP